jgi:hypothetical protein
LKRIWLHHSLLVRLVLVLLLLRDGSPSDGHGYSGFVGMSDAIVPLGSDSV